MKLTTKGKYAVTALLDMAVYGQSGPTTVHSIAQRQGISAIYLERLTGLMRSKGLLRSIKGPGGGYELTRLTTEITVADIIQAIEESVDVTTCKGLENCHNGDSCLTHSLWEELNTRIMEYLQSVTLNDLVQRSKIRSTIDRQQKQILLNQVK